MPKLTVVQYMFFQSPKCSNFILYSVHKTLASQLYQLIAPMHLISPQEIVFKRGELCWIEPIPHRSHHRQQNLLLIQN